MSVEAHVAFTLSGFETLKQAEEAARARLARIAEGEWAIKLDIGSVDDEPMQCYVTARRLPSPVEGRNVVRSKPRKKGLEQ